MVLQIIAPLPPRELSPNFSGHWSAKARAKKAYREAGFMAAFGIHNTPEWEPVRPIVISPEFYCGPSTFGGSLGVIRTNLYRPTDPDNANASLKSLIDGLIDAGLVPDDSAKWVSLENPKLYRKKKEHQMRSEVVLTITQQERR